MKRAVDCHESECRWCIQFHSLPLDANFQYICTERRCDEKRCWLLVFPRFLLHLFKFDSALVSDFVDRRKVIANNVADSCHRISEASAW